MPFVLATWHCQSAQVLSLAGTWRFALDRTDSGIAEKWFEKNLPDKIRLPGILQAQGYGDPIGIHTPWVLSLYDQNWFLRADYAAYTNAGNVKVPFVCQPPRHYLGVAWYQRDLQIPTNWAGKRLVLFLERPHWQTVAWLDGKNCGTNDSLCAPHEFELGIVGGNWAGASSEITPGGHRLTIRVDNRMILPYRPDAHSVSDSLGAAWNGIVGKLELRATPPVWIEDVQVYPHSDGRSVTVKGVLGNVTGAAATNVIVASLIPDMAAGGGAPQVLQIVSAARRTPFETVVRNTFPVKKWDEFHPDLFELTVTKRPANPLDETGWQRRTVRFGFRDLRAQGGQFILNGRPIYFRGTHDGGDFPLSGCPPMDVESWRKIIRTCKSYGLNHMRFHSWCPPEAAFEAADELGFYFQIEPGMWNSFSPGGGMEKMLFQETERIIKAYGNHPSFVLMSASNEAHGNWKPVLTRWVGHFRTRDPRRLYTPDTGWAAIDHPGPVAGADYLAVAHIGPHRLRGPSGWFGRDYGEALRGVNVPVIAHELGQWCAYPDFDIIGKFTGFMQPGNYEIFRDSAAAHGVLAQDKNFARASGEFQMECYKEEIEANLRTPGMAGFQLLDLHDYTGQGTALVGLLDTFWGSKGYATPGAFKKFCNAVVPLARLTNRVFTTSDPFNVPVEVANFSEAPLTNAPVGWEIVDPSNHIVQNGSLGSPTIPLGKDFSLGTIAADLSRLPAPAQYRLVVDIQNPPFENDWNFWLYPAQISESVPAGVRVTRSWHEAAGTLSAGGKVLFFPPNTDLDWTCPPLDVVPVFWNRLMNPAWGRMLGLWCDTNHPALAEFPTGENCDWQWTELLRNTRAVNLEHLPRGLTPIVSAIDDWNRNWKLGLIFEARVGAGRLVVCSADLDTNPSPVARQLRRSLLDYMAGPRFQPKTEISIADFHSLYFDSRIMRRLGARAEAGGQNAGAAIDGDPNTFWSVGGKARGTRPVPFPHSLTVDFPLPVAVSGIVIMPRQNDRNHLGDTRDFQVETSDGGDQWVPIARGRLASSWSPQTIPFGKTVTARRLRFTALSGFGDDSSTALAELAVIYAGPELPREQPGAMEFHRVRSTSADVDEAPGATSQSTARPRNQ